MKKKILLILLVILGLFAITGCGNNQSNPKAEKKANDILNNQTETKTDSKILIVYFSRTGENYNVGNVEVGNTAIMASYMKEYLNADSFEIVPVNKYPDSYDECLKVATYVGSPIYWGGMPEELFTALKGHDYNGKIIRPFTTHEGSGLSGVPRQLNEICVGAEVTSGIAIVGSQVNNSKAKVEEWI